MKHCILLRLVTGENRVWYGKYIGILGQNLQQCGYND
jgi:hypothetical protein